MTTTKTDNHKTTKPAPIAELPKIKAIEQGDDVILHGTALLDGATSLPGKVLKVLTDGDIAVRITRPNGTTQDFTPVHNADKGAGGFWYSPAA